jgi:alkylation response protein AidB-like acyl-CoA dehydrogenase
MRYVVSHLFVYMLLICRGCGGTGTIVSVHNTLYANVLDQLGTKEQKDKFLVGFADGTHVGCFGISEPGMWRIRNEYTNNMAGGQ